MRYAIDLAIFGGVFVLAILVFKSAIYAVAAAIIVAGAAEALIWDPKKD